MVSVRHQTLIRLIDECPEVLQELLRDRLELPTGAVPHTLSTDATSLVPAELRVDLVLGLRSESEIRMVIAVEVQLSIDETKTLAWPHYAANLRHRHRCPVVLVVLAPDGKVARWADRPITLGPGFVHEPVVLGPDDVPILRNPERARRQPELSVLSSLTHPDDGELALAALQAVLGRDD